MNLPQHVAIIMDGNGRWAKARGHMRTFGHMRGARVAKEIITLAVERGISYLTLFAFSTENWLRPKHEVDFLMRLLAKQILREREALMKNNVRFRVIGNVDGLPQPVRQIVLDSVEMTRQNTGMNLVFALNYGGRQEIAEAARTLAQKALEGQLDPETIDTETFASQLQSHFLPDPDLIIRTSGEQRLSNFYLWQSAYSEILILDKLWPEFTTADFDMALENYAGRERRFGRVEEATPPA